MESRDTEILFIEELLLIQNDKGLVLLFINLAEYMRVNGWMKSEMDVALSFTLMDQNI